MVRTQNARKTQMFRLLRTADTRSKNVIVLTDFNNNYSMCSVYVTPKQIQNELISKDTVLKKCRKNRIAPKQTEWVVIYYYG